MRDYELSERAAMEAERREEELDNDDNGPDERVVVEIDLSRSIKEASIFMGPGELATKISVALEDTQYLKDVIKQLQNNAENRDNLPL